MGKLGIREYLTLEINSLGNREERAAHRAALVEYLTRYEDKLDEDSKRRLKTNPLRVLDTKNPDFAGNLQCGATFGGLFGRGFAKPLCTLQGDVGRFGYSIY